MDISIVIPNYNGKELLEKNLPKVIEAILSYKEGDSEVIVTDDASKDDSILFLEKYFQEIAGQNISLKIIKSPFLYNTGFSSNINRGVKAAKGDIVILFNSDVKPHKEFLKPLLKHFENQQLFAVGC